MDVAHFVDSLGAMTADDLRRVSDEIEARHACVADDLVWWEATVDIDRALKLLHRRRDAAMAAHDAGRAVQRCGAGAGLSPQDAALTRVARAAAEVARGLAASPLADDAVRTLLAAFTPLFQRARA